MIKINDKVYLLESNAYTSTSTKTYGVYHEEISASGNVQTLRLQGHFGTSGPLYVTNSEFWNPNYPFQGEIIQEAPVNNGSFDFTIENNCVDSRYIIWAHFDASEVDVNSIQMNIWEYETTNPDPEDRTEYVYDTLTVIDPSYYSYVVFIRLLGEGAGNANIEVGQADLCDVCSGLGVVLKKHRCPKCNGQKVLPETFSKKFDLSNSLMNYSEYQAAFSIEEPTDHNKYYPRWWMGSLSRHILSYDDDNCKNGLVIRYKTPGKNYYSQTIEGYEWTCLHGDTLITMADDSTKKLSEIEVGDMVLSKDKTPIRVNRLEKGRFSSICREYTFDDGTVIKENGPHRFYNKEQGYWKKLQNWKKGERAIKIDGTEPAMVSEEAKVERTEMFGMFTEDGTYWANGLLCGSNKANLMNLNALNRGQQIAILSETDKNELGKYFLEENALGLSPDVSRTFVKFMKNEPETFGKKLYVNKYGMLDFTFEDDPMNFSEDEGEAK